MAAAGDILRIHTSVEFDEIMIPGTAQVTEATIDYSASQLSPSDDYLNCDPVPVMDPQYFPAAFLIDQWV